MTERVEQDKMAKPPYDLAKQKLGLTFDEGGFIKELEGLKSMLSMSKDILEENGLNLEELLSSLDACSEIGERDNFVEACFLALKPLIDFELEKPEEFRKIKARFRREEMDMSGKYNINEIFYYDLDGEGVAQIHVREAHDIKNSTKLALLRDCMKKLAKIVEQDENIRGISGTSWIVAHSPKLMRLLGFEYLGEIDKTNSVFKDDDRPVAKVFMSREELLRRYLK